MPQDAPSISRQLASAGVSTDRMRPLSVLLMMVVLGSAVLPVGAAATPARHAAQSGARGGGATQKKKGGHSSGPAGRRGLSAGKGGRGSLRHDRAARGRGKRGRGKRRGRPYVPPAMPSRIDVLGVDPEGGVVRVQLTGPSRAPEPRLFVLTDARGRRFVPLQAHCNGVDSTVARTPDGDAAPLRWVCTMSLAPAYRRVPLTGVAMEWGDRIVSAMPGQMKARWAATQDLPMPAVSPETPGGPESAVPAIPGDPDGGGEGATDGVPGTDSGDNGEHGENSEHGDEEEGEP